ncbi:MAG: hypothetical protein E7313_07115 [Clostridiales bacterium]|nr:hypothetical protein [Clostridiales bacterium]
MKKFRAYVKLGDDVPTEMIISEKDKELAKKKLADFFYRLDKNIKVKITIKEVYFDGNNYINKEDQI